LRADTCGVTPKTKRIVRAVVGGVLVQAVLLAAVLAHNTPDASQWLIWNLILAPMLLWVPQLVTGRHVVVDGFAIPFMLILVGFTLGIATYSTAIYFALRALDARRALRDDPTVR